MKTIITIICIFFLTSCKDGTLLESDTYDINSTITKAKERIDSITPSSEEVSEKAQVELEKLTSLEYKVIKIEVSKNSEEIEALLSNLGKTGWGCFHIERVKEEFVVFCSKRPKSYLRHITKFLHVPL